MYMGVTTAEYWSRQLIAAGKPASTPVAMLRRISWPDQQVIKCELGNVGPTLNAMDGLQPPVISIVGDVVSLPHRSIGLQAVLYSESMGGQHLACWCLSRRQTEKLRCRSCSGTCVEYPASGRLERHLTKPSIRQVSIGLSFPVSTASMLSCADFSIADLMEEPSENARSHRLVRRLTAALHQWHLNADCTPQTTGITALIDLLKIECSNRQFLFVRTASGKQEGVENLVKCGALVHSINVYRQVPVKHWPNKRIEQCESGEFDGILVTSSNIAESICRLIPNCHASQHWFSLSPGITHSLEAFGCTSIQTATTRGTR